MKTLLVFVITVILTMGTVIAPGYIKQEVQEYNIENKEISRETLELTVPERARKNKKIPVIEDKINTENILFIGNSLICGIDMVTDGHNFISEVGYTIKSLRTEGYYKYLDTYPLDTVIIELGTNELGWFGEDNFKNEFDILISEIQTRNSNSDIVLMTIPPVSEKRDSTEEHFNNKNVELYNKYLRDIAIKYNLMLIDTHEIFGDILSPEDTTDGIHLKGDKYKEWYDFIIKKLQDA